MKIRSVRMMILLLVLILAMPTSIFAQENTRTYVDPLVGYHFDYPLAWSFERMEDGSMRMIYLTEESGIRSPAIFRFRVGSYDPSETEDMEALMIGFFQEFINVELSPDDIETNEFNGLAGSSYTLNREGNVSFMQMIRLKPNLVLSIQTNDAQPAALWEGYYADLMNMLNSLDGDDAALPTASIQLDLPDNWILQETNLLTVETATPNWDRPEAIIRFTIGRPATIIEGGLGLSVADGDNPQAIFAAFQQQSEPNGREFTTSATPIEALGFEGSQLVFPENGSLFDLRLLDTGDDIYIFIVITYLSEANIAAYGDQVDQILANAEYVPPADAILE